MGSSRSTWFRTSATVNDSSSSRSSSSEEGLTSLEAAAVVPGGGAGPDGSAPTLQSSLDKLVDTAVGLVEEGRLEGAIQVLEQGVGVLTAAYPGSPELGELHNQVALLLLLADRAPEAEGHARTALDLTQAVFGPAHPLTAHRLLRLGVVLVHSGQEASAAPLLATASHILGGNPQDTGAAEAGAYTALLALSSATTREEVAAQGGPLSAALRSLVESTGPGSLLVRLAVTGHSRLLGVLLDRGFDLGEGAFKQHIALQELVDPSSPELGLVHYQLATTYYAHDWLTDAGAAVTRAAQLLQAHYPPDHDLLALCKHRMGMIAAAGRDIEAARRLLTASGAHYGAQGEGHPLAEEAAAGLDMVAFKALPPRLQGADRRSAQQEVLDSLKGHLTAMAKVLGPQHMLVMAAARYHAQLAVMAGLANP